MTKTSCHPKIKGELRHLKCRKINSKLVYWNGKMNKTRRLNLRLTDIEYLDFQHKMQEAGYKSMSKFARDRILGTAVSRKKRTMSDENLYRLLHQFTYEVKKIGVNYNQVVHNYNSQRGNISSYMTEKLMRNLEKLTRELLKDTIEIKEKLLQSDNGNNPS